VAGVMSRPGRGVLVSLMRRIPKLSHLADSAGDSVRSTGEKDREEGGKGGGGESRSTTGVVGVCDWDVPRGRPRRNEVRMFCLEGGESDPTK